MKSFDARTRVVIDTNGTKTQEIMDLTLREIMSRTDKVIEDLDQPIAVLTDMSEIRCIPPEERSMKRITMDKAIDQLVEVYSDSFLCDPERVATKWREEFGEFAEVVFDGDEIYIEVEDES